MSFRKELLRLLEALVTSSKQIELKQIWLHDENERARRSQEILMAELRAVIAALSPVAESAVEAMSYTGTRTWKYSVPGSTDYELSTSGVTADTARVNAAGALIFENVFISADPEDRPTERLVLAVHKGHWVDVWEEES